MEKSDNKFRNQQNTIHNLYHIPIRTGRPIEHPPVNMPDRYGNKTAKPTTVPRFSDLEQTAKRPLPILAHETYDRWCR